MTIKVLLFGATADAAGSRQIDLALDVPHTVGEAVERLRRKHPRLSSQKLLAAVNERYVSSDTVLENGDELAVFAPVSGG